MSRRATRYNHRDGNETLIVAALAAMGVDWVEAPPLDGWCFLGQWIPVEIKNPNGRNRKTDSQNDFIDACERDGKPYRIWRSANDAVEAVQTYREGRGP